MKCVTVAICYKTLFEDRCDQPPSHCPELSGEQWSGASLGVEESCEERERRGEDVLS